MNVFSIELPHHTDLVLVNINYNHMDDGAASVMLTIIRFLVGRVSFAC